MKTEKKKLNLKNAHANWDLSDACLLCDVFCPNVTNAVGVFHWNPWGE